MTPDPARLFHAPDLFPLQFHDGGLVFVPMSRDSYLSSVFTDPARVQTAGEGAWAMPLAELARRYQAAQAGPDPAVPARPPTLLLHMAHGGSTLLARALDMPAHALVVREPFALRQLAVAHVAAQSPDGAAHAMAPRQQAALLEMVLALLGRTHRAGVQAVVKANVPVNFLLPQILAMAPDIRGLVLHAGFDDFVLQAVKAPERERWVQGVLGQLAPAVAALPDGAHWLAATASVPAAAAVLWLAQRTVLVAALEAAANLRSLDAADWFAEPLAVLSAAAPQLGLHPAAAELAGTVSGPLFQQHAKAGQVFNAERRAQELAVLHTKHAAALAEAQAWMAEQAPDVPLTGPLPRPLLG